ncbi:MAG: hypothetical protein EOP70_14330 [Variovorax sp.]|jgi:hypothetical protein|nr:MAG: hypothetical protein EOP70_14330 [Variovorax sp.]
MSISLLQELADKDFPVVVDGGDLVDAVHILAIAGHVEARIAKAVRTADGWMNPTATILKITRGGRRMLAMFPPRADGRRRLG